MGDSPSGDPTRRGEGAVEVDHRRVTLRYREKGEGQALVMLPGWSQTAQLFSAQVEHFATTHRVVAVDHRGHGRSDAPRYGYHLHRLAADLHEVLCGLDLGSVTLLGHSMGCAVAWAYLELYGPDRLRALVLVDQMPSALRNPAWSDEEAESVGATLEAADLFGFTNSLRGDGEDPRIGFLDQVTSPGIAPTLLAELVEQNLLFERSVAAGLLFDTASSDWRSEIERISVPTLVVAGDSVNVPLRSQLWLHDHIAGSALRVVRSASGGTHFPFLENPDGFNRAVAEFLQGLDDRVGTGPHMSAESSG